MQDLIERSHEKVAHVFGGGATGDMLQGRFDTQAVHAWFQKRHRHFTASLIDPDGYCRLHDEKGDHEWKVPYGVRVALASRLTISQTTFKYPWFVTWVSPKTGNRLKKKFESLASAIVFVTTRAQYADPDAWIISRQGYDIPAKLRGKLPHKKLGYWCPCCMTNRKFFRVYPETTFHVLKKLDTSSGYKWTTVELKLLRCKVCGITNRNGKFRRSNQPWEVRKFKKGVTRAKRRR